MRVFVTGGTGLIGREVARRLAERGDTPIILSRDAEKARGKVAIPRAEFVQGDPTRGGDWFAAVNGTDAVVHLAGFSLFGKRWTDEVKRKIRDSRVEGTRNVAAAIEGAREKPRVLVQGSALGYYGPHGDEVLTEASPPGDDFLARVSIEWESAAKPVEAFGVRLPIVRTGIVLARGEGALGVMTPLFRIAPGAPVGSGGSPAPATGRQWMSWIHLEDIVGIILLGIDHPEAHGPLNGTAPNPARNADFSRELSRALWKPYAPWRVFLPIGPPDFMLNLILGEMAQVIVKGQRVLPTVAQRLGYTFRFPELRDALKDLFQKSERSSRS